jgi:hypothetical protein
MPQDDKTACKLSAVDNAQAIHGSSGQLISRKPGALLLVAAAYVLGGGGMLAWLLFLLMGPLVPLNLELGIVGRLLLDTFLCLLFFIQHSIMVRRRFRLWLTRSVRADFHGTLYAAASGTCLLLLTGLWQLGGAGAMEPARPDPMGDDHAVFSSWCRRLVGLPILGRLRCAGCQTDLAGLRQPATDQHPIYHSWAIPLGAPSALPVQPDHYLVLPDLYGGSVAAQRALDHLDHHRCHYGGAGSGRLFRRGLSLVSGKSTHAAAKRPETPDS